MKPILKITLFWIVLHCLCTIGYYYVDQTFLNGIDINLRYAIFVVIQFVLMMTQSIYIYKRNSQIQWLKLLPSVFIAYFIGMLISPFFLEMLGKNMSNSNLLGDGIKLFLGVGIFFSSLSVLVANKITSRSASLG